MSDKKYETANPRIIPIDPKRKPRSVNPQEANDLADYLTKVPHGYELEEAEGIVEMAYIAVFDNCPGFLGKAMLVIYEDLGGCEIYIWNKGVFELESSSI